LIQNGEENACGEKLRPADIITLSTEKQKFTLKNQPKKITAAIVHVI